VPRPDRRGRARGQCRVAGALIVAAFGACGYDSPAARPTPGPTPVPAPTAVPGATVVPGEATGPTQIGFVSAEPAAGSTISGCGSRIGGCAGRVRMTFRLRSASGGHVLFMRAYLHDTRKIACFTGRTEAFDIDAGQARDVEVLFDQSDDVCGTPSTITNMDAGVEGTIEIASRQEWALRYDFAP
jgi:hypothetical protein